MNRNVQKSATEENEASKELGSREASSRHSPQETDNGHDKTLADSFPTSDPPSTIPDPGADEGVPEHTVSSIQDELVRGLPAGSWAAISIEERRVVGKGTTQEQAAEDARRGGHSKISLVQVRGDQEAPGQTLNLAS